MLSSSDDDLPDVPVLRNPRDAMSGPYVTRKINDPDDSCVTTEQERRLNLLERELQQLRKDIHGSSRHSSDSNGTSSAASQHGACIYRKAALSHSVPSEECMNSAQSMCASSVETAELTEGTEKHNGSANEQCASHQQSNSHRARCYTNDLAVDARRSEEVMYELHSLVPHLSTSFTCYTRDALLIIMSIRNGGTADGNMGMNTNGVAGTMPSSSPATHKTTTLIDRVSLIEAEKRGLEQRLHARVTECELLKDELASAKQRLQAVQQQSLQTQATLSQRREEMRRQLMLEETRCEKMRVRNRKLEAEVEQLKDRLRAQLR